MGRNGINPKRRWNKRGAIEGLPLQLIIMVVIAGIAIVIILSWLQPWKNKVDLQSVSASPGTVARGVATQVTVTAWDTKDNKLSGVVVVLDGAGVHASGTTDSTGTVKFTITPSLPPGTSSGQVSITATYTGSITVEKTNLIVVT
ncbi:MAG: hypothetical protein V1934_02150 [Methanobacteriota archaeon]